jgi:hypothetical protein
VLVVLAVALLTASLSFDALALVVGEPAFSLLGLRDLQGSVVILAVAGVFTLADLARPPRSPREDALALARAGLCYGALALAGGALGLRGALHAPPGTGAVVLAALALACELYATWLMVCE